VLYSSAVSLLGSPGQANYVAANAFLDALSHHRRGLGLAAMSINWGAFSEVGLAAAQDNRGARLASRGMRSLSPAEGEEVLGRLLRRPRAQVGVMALDVRQWLDFYPSLGSSPFWSELRKERGAAASAPGPSVGRTALTRARPGDRPALLEEQLRGQFAEVLRLPASRIDSLAGFSSLGMDSLISLELRNRLEASFGLKLPASLLFMVPNLSSLTGHLLDTMGLPVEEHSGSAPGGEGGASVSVDEGVELLNNDELMALFDEPK
jgi:acyl carrier protein